MFVLLATLLTPGAEAADYCVPQGYAPSGVTCAASGDFPMMLEQATTGGSHTVHLEPGLQVSDVSVITTGEVTIQTEAGADRATFTGAGGAAGVFSISGAATDVTFRNVDFEVPSGNAVLVATAGATLRLEDVEVRDPETAVSNVSAIEVTNGVLDAVRLEVSGFDSSRRGAQLELLNSDSAVSDSTFRDARTTGNRGGGAIYLEGGTALFAAVRFLGNESDSNEGGGAVYVRSADSPPVFEGCIFEDNQAINTSRGGGAVHLHSSGATFRSDSTGSPTTFERNNSDGCGGAVRMNQSTQDSSFFDTRFVANSADKGGAIDLNDGVAVFDGVVFCDNAAEEGGAAFVGSGDLTLERSAVVRSDADVGPAVLHLGSSLIVDHVTVLNNGFGQGSTRVIEMENGGTGLQVTNSAFLFHDGQVLDDDAQQGTWSHNAWLDNTVDYTGDGSFQTDAVLSGDSFVNPNPACVLEALMPGDANSALVGMDDVGGTIGAVEFTGVDADGDGWAGTSDCDDNNASVFPGASLDGITMADGIDQDCDGFEECFLDEDGDGVGGTMLPVELGVACADENALDQGGDCDDTDPAVFPNAPLDADAVLDMVDTDCDGMEECFEDLDNDAYGSEVVIVGNGDGVCNAIDGESPNDQDCNDLSPQLSPAVDEVCDGFDNDCDGLIDDDDDVLSAQLYTTDSDGDGFGNVLEAGEPYCTAPMGLGLRGDCDDDEPTTYPGAIEACPDGVDNDCDGEVDTEDDDYSPTPLETWRDEDGDGFGTSADVLQACSSDVTLGYVPPGVEDCDDTDPFISPDANELCDGVDEDCNGLVDDGLPTFPLYDDLDGDGFGDPTTEREVCELDGVGILTGEDCDDADPGVNPEALETCDGIDEDCDGLVDEGLEATTTYEDADGDGFGDDSTAEVSCEPAGERVEVAGDCDDSNRDVNPSAEEVCDGLDNDCDGEADPVCGRPVVTGCRCGAGSGRIGLVPALLVLAVCCTRRRRIR